MGQKVNPNGMRLGISRDWNTKWYAPSRDYAATLASDLKLRRFIMKRLANAAVSRVVIDRPAQNLNVTIYTARPGIVIGKKGEDIERLRAGLSRLNGSPVQVAVEEIRKPELDAKLVAEALGLTGAESEVAVMLSEGRPIRDIAAARGCKPGTVHDLIKRAHKRLGISRQVDLVRMVLQLGDLPAPQD